MADKHPAIKKEVIIGDCRLILGDCLEVMPLLEPIDSLVADPPYGMDFKSNHRNISHREISNDKDSELLKFACSVDVMHSAYIWMRWDNLHEVPKPKSLITWVKNNHSMGDLEHEHGRKTEVAAFYTGPNHFFPSGRPTDVIFAKRTGNDNHPTEKPVSLMVDVVRNTYGRVVDITMGSGTTGVACVKLGRKFTGIELDSDYFEISCDRIRKAYEQPDMFVAPPSKPLEPVQIDILQAEADNAA